MAASFVLQGRALTDADLEEIRLLIRSSPEHSRRKLSKELAQRWNWKDLRGQLKDMAARTLMLKLHERGLIELPACRSIASKRRARPLELFVDPPPPDICESFATITPLSITVVSRTDKAYRLLSRHLERYHYLGFKGPVGENLMYRVQDRRGRSGAVAVSIGRPPDGYRSI